MVELKDRKMDAQMADMMVASWVDRTAVKLAVQMVVKQAVKLVR